MLLEHTKLLERADKILLAFSGGKDSLSCLLFLLELGYQDKLELIHNIVDGIDDHFMDWRCTKAYCLAVADYFNLPLYSSWREGGFRRKMLRDDQPTAPVWFEDADGNLRSSGGTGNPNTRRLFPMPTASLKIRWCSSALKITCMDASIRNQSRFDGKCTVVITGERAEESAARAKYSMLQPHTTNCQKREVWHYRPIIHWLTADVWKIIRQWSIVAHPSYYLGYARCSCATCIFLNNDDLATYNAINPQAIAEITNYEREFGKTISYDKSRKVQLTTADKAARGTPHAIDRKWAERAMSETWDYPIYLPPDKWELPLGAYSGSLASGSP